MDKIKAIIKFNPKYFKGTYELTKESVIPTKPISVYLTPRLDTYFLHFKNNNLHMEWKEFTGTGVRWFTGSNNERPFSILMVKE